MPPHFRSSSIFFIAIKWCQPSKQLVQHVALRLLHPFHRHTFSFPKPLIRPIGQDDTSTANQSDQFQIPQLSLLAFPVRLTDSDMKN
jgi:hypothetical protein